MLSKSTKIKTRPCYKDVTVAELILLCMTMHLKSILQHQSCHCFLTEVIPLWVSHMFVAHPAIYSMNGVTVKDVLGCLADALSYKYDLP